MDGIDREFNNKMMLNKWDKRMMQIERDEGNISIKVMI